VQEGAGAAGKGIDGPAPEFPAALLELKNVKIAAPTEVIELDPAQQDLKLDCPEKHLCQ